MGNKQKNQGAKRTLFEVNGNLETIPTQFNAAKNALIAGDVRRYEEKMLQGILAMERATLRLRDVAAVSFRHNNNPLFCDKMMTEIAEKAHHITVEQAEDVVRITMPCLIPHYKESYKTMLSAPLSEALRNYQKEHGSFPDYKAVVVVVINHVPSDTPYLLVRDNDNYDYKQVINTLTFHLLPDDGYKYCNFMNMTKLGPKNMTEIFVVPRDKFGRWYKKNEGYLAA